ncbi:hypothetical protein LWI29_027417 [Acer saccharum]|uniref:Uncharacterized protein n=1 Tax=Acer saccharum TaxID=4024 RepID=A0AA39T6H6_ACESA|nr:hypothetical protein LWI29_027417 [Acer saccharum]
MLDIGATALVTEAATAIFGKAGVSAAAVVMTVDKASYILDAIAIKHNVCGFYFGHPVVYKLFQCQGKGEFVNNFIVKLDGTRYQKGRLFSIVGEENSSKCVEAVIRAEYPNISKNRLNRDYKDTYAAIEVSEDFLFYANGVRNFKDYLGNSFVFDPVSDEVNPHLASHARNNGYVVD